jgi:hypothetical protein
MANHGIKCDGKKPPRLMLSVMPDPDFQAGFETRQLPDIEALYRQIMQNRKPTGRMRRLFRHAGRISVQRETPHVPPETSPSMTGGKGGWVKIVTGSGFCW